MNKKYQVLYCDPPWRYGVDGQYVEPSRKIENHYPTMSLDDIKAIKVPAEDNSVMFMWSTTAKLSESLEVLKAWGFFYKSSLIWDKVTMGMGFWFRGQHEFLLVGVKGKFSPPPQPLRIRSIYVEKRTIHSRKPNKIRELISQWYPSCTKLEMFARPQEKDIFGKSPHDGWDCIGNEIGEKITL